MDSGFNLPADSAFCQTIYNGPSTVGSVLQQGSLSSVTITALMPTQISVTSPSTTTVSYTTSTTITDGGFETIFAPSIEVRYRNNDAVIQSPLAQYSSTSMSTNATSVNFAGSTGEHKLSAGAMAGVVIGAIVILTLILAGGWFCWRRKTTSVQTAAEEEEWQKSELEAKTRR